jgi:acetamidase/formamidase
MDSGEVVEFSVRVASDEQLSADSASEDVAKLDYDHLNPVSGPVYVRAARQDDVRGVSPTRWWSSPARAWIPAIISFTPSETHRPCC